MSTSRMLWTPPLPSLRSYKALTILGTIQAPSTSPPASSNPSSPSLPNSNIPYPPNSSGPLLKIKRITPSSTFQTAPSTLSPVHPRPLSSTTALTSLLTSSTKKNTSVSLNKTVNSPCPLKTPLSTNTLDTILESTLLLRTSQPPPFHRPSLQRPLPPSHLPPPNYVHPLWDYYHFYLNSW